MSQWLATTPLRVLILSLLAQVFQRPVTRQGRYQFKYVNTTDWARGALRGRSPCTLHVLPVGAPEGALAHTQHFHHHLSGAVTHPLGHLAP